MELDGQCVGELSDYLWADLFWDSYAVTPMGDSNPPHIMDDELWQSCRFAF